MELAPLLQAVDLASSCQAVDLHQAVSLPLVAHPPEAPLLVQSVQAHRAEPQLLEDLEDSPLVQHLVELLVNHLLEVLAVSALLSPVPKED